ncbi:MAG: hypothetical protein AAFZ63_19235 [Bacteroidota bacterium]
MLAKKLLRCEVGIKQALNNSAWLWEKVRLTKKRKRLEGGWRNNVLASIDSFLLQENEIREIDSKKSMIDTANMQEQCEV